MQKISKKQDGKNPAQGGEKNNGNVIKIG